MRKNHSFRARALSRKTSQTIPTLQHTFSTEEGQHTEKVGQCLFHLYSKASRAGLRFLTFAETQVTVCLLSGLYMGQFHRFTIESKKMEDTDIMNVWHTKGSGNFFGLNSFYFDFI